MQMLYVSMQYIQCFELNVISCNHYILLPSYVRGEEPGQLEFLTGNQFWNNRIINLLH